MESPQDNAAKLKKPSTWRKNTLYHVYSGHGSWGKSVLSWLCVTWRCSWNLIGSICVMMNAVCSASSFDHSVLALGLAHCITGNTPLSDSWMCQILPLMIGAELATVVPVSVNTNMANRAEKVVPWLVALSSLVQNLSRELTNDREETLGTRWNVWNDTRNVNKSSLWSHMTHFTLETDKWTVWRYKEPVMSSELLRGDWIRVALLAIFAAPSSPVCVCTSLSGRSQWLY